MYGRLARVLPGRAAYPDIAFALVFVALVCIFAWRLQAAAWIGSHDDEASQIVAARLVGEGYTLYSEVFGHKGPGAIMAAWIGETLGARTLVQHRILPALLMLASVLAVAASPALRTMAERVTAAAVLALLLGTLHLVWSGQMLHYKVLSASLGAIGFSLAVWPALLGVSPGRWRGGLAGFAIGLLPAMVLTYLVPAAAMLALVLAGLAARRGPASGWAGLAPVLAGFGAALLCTGLWMLAFADFEAFWQLNVDFNLDIYADFISTGAVRPFLLLGRALSGRGEPIDGGLFVLALACWTGAALYFALRVRADARWRRYEWPIRAALFGLLMLTWFSFDPRGAPGWHAAPLYVAAFAAFALMIGHMAGKARPAPVAAALVLAAGAGILAAHVRANGPAEPVDWAEAGGPDGWLAGLPQVQAMMAIADPHERVAAYPFLPTLHVAARRLPASPVYQYLPWQAAWDAHRGRSPVICDDLAADPPPVVIVSHAAVWNQFRMRDYAPCLLAFLNAGYEPVSNGLTRIYARRDRLDRAGMAGFSGWDAEAFFLAAEPLHDGLTLRQFVDVPESAGAFDLHLASYAGTSAGVITLRLIDADGQIRFEASLEAGDLQDNSYYRFALPRAASGFMTLQVSGQASAPRNPAGVWTVSPARHWYETQGDLRQAGLCLRWVDGQGGVIDAAPGCPAGSARPAP